MDFITRRYHKLEENAKERIERVNKIVDDHYEFETDYELTEEWIQQLRAHIETVKIRSVGSMHNFGVFEAVNHIVRYFDNSNEKFFKQAAY